MLNELDVVVLTHDIPEKELREGDVGAIVHVATNPEAYMVEFVAYDGHTVALLSVNRSSVRKPAGNEIPHVRSTSAAA